MMLLHLENAMHNTYQNMYSSALRFILAGILCCAAIGCDSVLPAKFKAKDINAQDIDLRAGKLLASDTVNDAHGITVAYQYGPVLDSAGIQKLDSAGNPLYRSVPVTWSVLSSRPLESFSGDTGGTVNQIIHTNFQSLADSLPSLHSDSLLSISYDVAYKVSYAVLRVSQAEDIYIYTSLYYYLVGNNISNAGDYVSVDLVSKDTLALSSSLLMPQESVYGSTETIADAQATSIVSLIGARYTFHVDKAGVYLVRFTLSNPTEISNPQAQVSGFPSIADKFKVVILSF